MRRLWRLVVRALRRLRQRSDYVVGEIGSERLVADTDGRIIPPPYVPFACDPNMFDSERE